MKDIRILYHADCTDGFGGAYAAWKKFGDDAEYIPVSHANPPPAITNNEIYLIDFCYPKEEMDILQKNNKRFVVLDHHRGSREIVESMPEHVFDNERSGAGISWSYFHPNVPLPLFIAYVQDNDLWSKKLPHARDIAVYTNTIPFTFTDFENAQKEFENEESFAKIIEIGRRYREYADYICTSLAKEAHPVQFDEYTVLAVNAPRYFRSQVGNLLALKQGPFGVVYARDNDKWHFSLRGDNTIDLSEIAKKHGGGGHKNAAGFYISASDPFPFTQL